MVLDLGCGVGRWVIEAATEWTVCVISPDSGGGLKLTPHFLILENPVRRTRLDGPPTGFVGKAVRGDPGSGPVGSQ